jgi:hypothetical protein
MSASTRDSNQNVGRSFVIAGWAIDLARRPSRCQPARLGVSKQLGATRLLGAASPAAAGGRGTAFGNRFTPSGWGSQSRLSPGTYTLVASVQHGDGASARKRR